LLLEKNNYGKYNILLQMNLQVLSEKSQKLFNDFNIEYKLKMHLVMNELLIKNKERIDRNKYCYNCGSNADEKYSRYIFWCEYKFCSGRCHYDVAYDMRKGCRL